ncbi:hypothetical protein GMRT_13114 [Giardia muris]|uniref:Uncharacterized protein n=1 Tax=Giardia muris TaxID=5742 RepID=A0A4Z1T8S1_GIAMU|nr:hypothetical protein GMRT_13114 [Giardia muris]|eukprot:TNJ30523.1 hypothetical protein GMRT_13114 [Giardia muris]
MAAFSPWPSPPRLALVELPPLGPPSRTEDTDTFSVATLPPEPHGGSLSEPQRLSLSFLRLSGYGEPDETLWRAFMAWYRAFRISRLLKRPYQRLLREWCQKAQEARCCTIADVCYNLVLQRRCLRAMRHWTQKGTERRMERRLKVADEFYECLLCARFLRRCFVLIANRYSLLVRFNAEKEQRYKRIVWCIMLRCARRSLAALEFNQLHVKWEAFRGFRTGLILTYFQHRHESWLMHTVLLLWRRRYRTYLAMEQSFYTQRGYGAELALLLSVAPSDTRILIICFRAWQGLLLRRVHRRQVQQIGIQRCQTLLLRRSLKALRTHYRRAELRRRRMSQLRILLEHRLLHEYLQEWYENARQEHVSRLKRSVISRRLNQRLCRIAFEQWYHTYQRVQRFLINFRDVLLRIKHYRLRYAFSAMCERFVECRRESILAEDFLKASRQRQLQMALTIWYSKVLRQQTLCGSFMTIVDEYIDEAYARATSLTIKGWARESQLKILASVAFSAFRERYNRRMAQRERHRVAIKHYETRLYWRMGQATFREARGLTICQIHNYHMLIDALRHWRLAYLGRSLKERRDLSDLWNAFHTWHYQYRRERRLQQLESTVEQSYEYSLKSRIFRRFQRSFRSAQRAGRKTSIVEARYTRFLYGCALNTLLTAYCIRLSFTCSTREHCARESLAYTDVLRAYSDRNTGVVVESMRYLRAQLRFLTARQVLTPSSSRDGTDRQYWKTYQEYTHVQGYSQRRVDTDELLNHLDTRMQEIDVQLRGLHQSN